MSGSVCSAILEMTPKWKRNCFACCTKQALIDRLHKSDGSFITIGMTLLEVFAKLDGWAERPFFFRVKEEGAHGPLMKGLLAKVDQPPSRGKRMA